MSLTLSSEDRFVVYRLPRATDVHIVRHFGPLLPLEAAHFDRDGFVVRPFDGGRRGWFFRADARHRNVEWTFRSFRQPPERVGISREQYLEHLRCLISNLQEGEKVVLSRNALVTLDGLSLEEIFSRLERAFPGAFVYAWHSPETGTWVGATPELLIKRTDEGWYETVALAGTRRLDAHQQLSWTTKEQEEQRLVTEYIAGVLQRYSNRVEVETVGELRIGRLLHLKSRIVFYSERSMYEIAEALHPTPAVCGYPKDKALRLIGFLEVHDRKYYTGYAGITGVQGALYVVLRCMEYFDGAGVLYAGGGILSSSDPDSEWEETEAKMAMLTAVLKED